MGRDLTAIIKKAMKGDQEAFETLYRRYIKDILYTSRGLLDDPAEVEDAAQDAVLALYRNIGSLSSPYAFYSYMMRTVRTTCIHRNKKRRATSTENIEDVEGELVSREELPDIKVEKYELREAIRRVLEKLPEKQRLALYMYYYRELSYKEIASALEITTQTVGTNILKAKKTLKKLIDLEEEYKDENMTLRGAAFAPSVVQAFQSDMSAKVLPSQIDKVTAVINKNLFVAAKPVATGVGGVLKMAGFAKTLAISLTTVTAVAGGIVTYDVVHDLKPAAPVVIQQEVWTPNAEIIFVSEEGRAGQDNPLYAEFQIEEGDIGAWSIVDVNGVSVRTGASSVIEAELSGLEPGTYVLEWSAIHPDGRSVKAKREFFVSPPAEETTETESEPVGTEDGAMSQSEPGDTEVGAMSYSEPSTESDTPAIEE